MYPVAFYNGVRLWQNALHLRERPATSAELRKAGLSRTRGIINPRSPSFHSTIAVMTTQMPIDGDAYGSKVSIGTFNRQTTKMLYVLASYTQLKNQSASFGDVAWVDDDEQVLTITGGPYSGVAPVAVSGTGWTPASGDLALFRDPATGNGFVAPVVGFSGGALTVHLQSYTLERHATTGLPILADRTVTSAWLVYKVAYYYPRSAPILMDDPPPEGRAEDKFGTALQWQFVTEADVVYPSGVSIDLT